MCSDNGPVLQLVPTDVMSVELGWFISAKDLAKRWFYASLQQLISTMGFCFCFASELFHCIHGSNTITLFSPLGRAEV